MGQQPYRRYSFILTLWAEEDTRPGAPSVWRYSLEDPHRSQRHGFKDLAELMGFLERWTGASPEEPPMDR